MALLDALTRSYGIPLYVFFGGASTSVETDMSIPMVTPEHGYELAKDIVARGINTVAGGAFALHVRNSLHATAYGLATGGVAKWYNPAWLFVNGFNRVFLRISGWGGKTALAPDSWCEG